MNKEKIKQKMKELDAFGKGLNTFGKELEVFGKELEVWLEEPEDKADSEFILKLNTGRFYYHGDGDIRHDPSIPRYRPCFNSFITKDQTEIAVKRMSAQNELLQMAFILNDGWKPDWKDHSEQKFAINFDNGSHNFFCDAHYVYSSSHVFFKNSPLFYFVATASDNLKAYIKGELQ